MSKVSIIMARGIEGCGVTKYTVEQVKWLKAHGYETKVYASKDKTFSRKNAHDLGHVDLFKFAEEAQNTLLSDRDYQLHDALALLRQH
jgi:hypothetical protein